MAESRSSARSTRALVHWLTTAGPGVGCLASTSAPLLAQTVAFHGVVPLVVSANSPSQVPYEAQVTGTPTRVTFDFVVGTPRTIDLRDDGNAGDRTAGDRVYTVLFATADIIAALRTDDVHRVFVGFLNLFNGATNVFRGNVFVDVYENDIGTFPIVQLSPSVQATPWLVNINDPSYFTSNDAARVTAELFRWFGDDYDFLNLIYQPGRFQNRNHFQVRNDVDGIGLPRTNNTRAYGSMGRLQGISQFPTPAFFDGAEAGYIHELGHQWINFLNFAPLAQGIPHWPYSTMAGGVMGISIGGPGGQGGTFSCNATVNQNVAVVLNPRPNGPVYNDLELYLMGLLPASQVRTQAVFVDQAAAASLTCTGQTYAGAVTLVTAQAAIARYGPRNPSAGATQYRIGTILVTRNGLASPETMWMYSWLANRAEGRAPVPAHSGFVKVTDMPFYVATGQRASLDAHIDIGQPGAPSGLTTSAAGSSVALSWSAPATGRPPTQYIIDAGSASGLADLASLPTGNTATSFSTSGVPAGSYFIRVRAANAFGTGPASNQAVLVVGGPCTALPGAPTDLAVQSNAGGSVTLTWSGASGDPTFYVVEAGSAAGTSNLATVNLAGVPTTFAATGVPRGTYYIRVRAKNACGVGPASSEVVVSVS